MLAYAFSQSYRFFTFLPYIILSHFNSLVNSKRVPISKFVHIFKQPQIFIIFSTSHIHIPSIYITTTPHFPCKFLATFCTLTDNPHNFLVISCTYHSIFCIYGSFFCTHKPGNCMNPRYLPHICPEKRLK